MFRSKRKSGSRDDSGAAADRQTARDARQRPARRITPQYLENSALHYLQRFSSSAEGVRQVLRRKLRHGDLDEDQTAEAERWIDAVVEKLTGLGLISDSGFAAARAASLHRRGTAVRGIRARLAAKGVDADTIAEAVDDLADRSGAETTRDLDLAAAVALARRRRLGPYRTQRRQEMRERDIAALCRGGFGLDLARQVVDAEDAEALLEG
ncbi:MAG TPA: RecX family transcriptional regulator [Alphaproteobacteria bacterium]|nr:RecX family transcriptional regulator [Alphaproteobacteria bacterium]